MARTAQVTANPSINRLLTGHFRQTTGYRVLRPAGTTDWLLIYTIRGSGDFGIATAVSQGAVGRIATKCGDLVLIPPNTLHDYATDAAAKRWELLWAHFHPRPDWQAWLDWTRASRPSGLMHQSILNTRERQTIENALRRMNDFALSSHRLSRSMAMNALEEAILWCAKRVLRNTDHDPRVEMAEEYLCQHLRENVTLDQLAAVIGVSVSRLSYLFKKHTGGTAQRFYETQRLERARQLLECTTLPIKSIATEVGFDNPFYFTLRFKRYTGTSPREYRKLAQ